VTGTGDFSVQEAPPRTWADADAYCNGLAYGGGGWRLPNKVELVALYNAYPLNQVHTVLGWETGERYWSSSPHETVVDSYYAVFLSNGDDSTFNNVNINFFPVTCIR
jgi:adhesin/invasin